MSVGQPESEIPPGGADYLANQPAIRSFEHQSEDSPQIEVSAPSKKGGGWSIHLFILIAGAAMGFGLTMDDTGVDDGLRDKQEGEGYVERSAEAVLLESILLGYPYFFCMNLCCFAPLAGAVFLSEDDDWWDWPPWYLKKLFGQS